MPVRVDDMSKVTFLDEPAPTLGRKVDPAKVTFLDEEPTAQPLAQNQQAAGGLAALWPEGQRPAAPESYPAPLGMGPTDAWPYPILGNENILKDVGTYPSANTALRAVAAGAQTGADSMASMAARGIGAVVPAANNAADQMNRASNKFQKEAAALDQPGVAGYLGKTLRGTVGSLIPSVAGGLMLGPAGMYPAAAGSAVFAGASEANQAVTEGKDAGLGGGDLAGYVARAAAIEAGPALLFQAAGLPGMERVFGQVGKDAAARGIKAALKQFGKDILSELPEENITEIGHNINAALSGVNPEALSPEQLFQTIVDTTAQTLMTMGLTRAPGATRRVAKKVTDRRDELVRRDIEADRAAPADGRPVWAEKMEKDFGAEVGRGSVKIGERTIEGYTVKMNGRTIFIHGDDSLASPKTVEQKRAFLESAVQQHRNSDATPVMDAAMQNPTDANIEMAYQAAREAGINPAGTSLTFADSPEGARDISGVVFLADPEGDMRNFDHELFHNMLPFLLNKSEYDTVMKRHKGDEEAAVNDYLRVRRMQSAMMRQASAPERALWRFGQKARRFVSIMYGGKDFGQIAEELGTGVYARRGEYTTPEEQMRRGAQDADAGRVRPLVRVNAPNVAPEVVPQTAGIEPVPVPPPFVRPVQEGTMQGAGPVIEGPSAPDMSVTPEALASLYGAVPPSVAPAVEPQTGGAGPETFPREPRNMGTMQGAGPVVEGPQIPQYSEVMPNETRPRQNVAVPVPPAEPGPAPVVEQAPAGVPQAVGEVPAEVPQAPIEPIVSNLPESETQRQEVLTGETQLESPPAPLTSITAVRREAMSAVREMNLTPDVEAKVKADAPAALLALGKNPTAPAVRDAMRKVAESYTAPRPKRETPAMSAEALDQPTDLDERYLREGLTDTRRRELDFDEPMRYSTAQRDAEYMSAVERGDMETAQRMVDEAAKRAGMIPLYHGTTKVGSAKIEQEGALRPNAEPAVYMTTSSDVVGYGDTLLRLAVREDRVEIDDEFPSGRKDYRIETGYEGSVQVKSADPVTRDDKGNVIPLSKRFDTSSPDIRYSTSAVPDAPRRKYQMSAYAALMRHGADDAAYREEMRAAHGPEADKYLDQFRKEFDERMAEINRRAQVAAANTPPGYTPRPDRANFGETPEEQDMVNAADAAEPRQEPQTVRGHQEAGAAWVESVGLEEAERVIRAKVAAKEGLTPEETTGARIVFRDLAGKAVRSGKREDHIRAQEFAALYRESGSSASQSLNARRLLRNSQTDAAAGLLEMAMSPSRRLEAKITEAREALKNKRATKQAIKRNQQRLALLNARAAAEGMRRVKWLQRRGWDMSDAGLWNIARNDDLLHRFKREIHTDRATVWDKVFEFRQAALLSKALTHIKNIVSSPILASLELGPQRAIEGVLNLAYRNPEAATLGELPVILRSALRPRLYAQAAMNGIRSMIQERQVFAEMMEGQDADSLGVGARFLDERGPAIKGVKGRVIRFPLTMLGAADDFLRTIIGTTEASAQAYRIATGEGLSGKARKARMDELVGDMGSDAWKAATDTAHRLLFTAQGGKTQQYLGKARDILWGARYIVPFYKSPANLWRTGIRKGGGAPIALAMDIAKGESPDKKVRHAAETLIASAFWYGVSALLHGDDDEPWITGANPPGGADSMWNVAPYQLPPNSVKVNGEWRDYRVVEPLGTAVSFIVTTVETLDKMKDGEEYGKQALVGLTKFTNQFLEQPMLTGLKDFIDIMAAPGRRGEQFATSFLSSFMPNAVKGTVRDLDETVRERDGSTFWEKLQYDLLPTPDKMPPKVDVYGQEIRKGGSFVDRSLNPMRVTKSEDADYVTGEVSFLIRQYNTQNPDTPFQPQPPSDRITDRGETYTLTPEETAEYRRKAGEYTVKALGTVLHRLNPDAPTGKDIEIIEKQIARGRDRARTEMLRSIRSAR